MGKKRTDYQVGDWIGFQGNHWASKAIGLVTWGFPFWPFYLGISHIGIIGEYKKQLYLFESTELTDLPCAILGTKIAGTQAHKLEDRLKVYDGRAYHYPRVAPLYPHEKKRLNKWLFDHLGRPYDRIGAVRSADGFAWLETYREDQMASLYCSEAVEAVERYVGTLDSMNLGTLSPNRLVRVGRRHGLVSYRRRIL